MQQADDERAGVWSPRDLPADEQATFRHGVAAFNAGDYYAAHDDFEALWGEDFWKGLVQAAVALHHHQVGNPRGIIGLPGNVRRLLDPYRPAYMGLDVARFLADFTAFFDAVDAGGATPPAPRLHHAGRNKE